ncbi:Thioredoxin reductase (EC [Olavius algarvensis associated proteobacterium Delta 3]|nr:Thioredoxin reductase (EC [Olavius algarvensis associated proteobacterium Delta 3]
MTTPDITVYGAHWCPDCRRSKQFLGEHQILYNWIDIEQDAAAEEFVIETNQGKRIIPTITFPDGTFLTEPSNSELAQKLGLKTEAERKHYDLIVLGGGPAGLTAALYTAREAIDTLVIERAAFGGQAAGTEKLDNMPGFHDGVSGADFSKRLRKQAERFGVELLQAQDVTGIHSHDNYHCATTADGSQYSAQAMLIATGSRYKRLNVPGEANYSGAGVHFCATCDGPFYKGKRVAVVGGGNSAAEESLLLTKFADHVTILVRGSEFKASQIIQDSVLSHPKITVHWNTEVREFLGEQSKLNRIKVVNNQSGKEEEMAIDGAFIFIGLVPNTGFLKDSPVLLDKWGFVITGHSLIHRRERPDGFQDREPLLLETSVPGIFAAGDVRDDSTKQVVSAAGEGSTAALEIREYLKMV